MSDSISSEEFDDLMARYVVEARRNHLEGDKPTVRSLLLGQGVEESEPLKLRGPGIYWVIGKTMSGKTNALQKLARYLDEMILFTVKDDDGKVHEVPIEEFHYYYREVWQKNPFDEMESKYNVQFHDECPSSEDINELCKDRAPRVVVLDDMMDHIMDSPEIVQLLTRQVHHLNIMVFLVAQMLHPTGKNAVGLREQGHGYFFFEFTANERGLNTRFRALTHTRHVDSVMRFYKSMVQRSQGYMYVDCHPLQASKRFKFYGNIFPDEGVTRALPLSEIVGRKRKLNEAD